MLHRARRISPLTWMVALLLAATFLRLAAWRAAPPGLRYDEMTVVYEADEIRAGARPIYMDGSAEEALYHYFFAAVQDLIAPHLFTLRWLSAAFGLISMIGHIVPVQIHGSAAMPNGISGLTRINRTADVSPGESTTFSMGAGSTRQRPARVQE